MTRELPPSRGLSRTAILGLARSVGWLEMYVGLAWVLRAHRASGRGPAHGAAEFDGVDRGSSTEHAGDRRLQRRRLAAGRGARRAARGASSPSSAPRPTAHRCAPASAGSTPTPRSIRFVGGVAEIAANTPDSIPRRLPLLGAVNDQQPTRALVARGPVAQAAQPAAASASRRAGQPGRGDRRRPCPARLRALAAPEADLDALGVLFVVVVVVVGSLLTYLWVELPTGAGHGAPPLGLGGRPRLLRRRADRLPRAGGALPGARAAARHRVAARRERFGQRHSSDTSDGR